MQCSHASLRTRAALAPVGHQWLTEIHFTLDATQFAPGSALGKKLLRTGTRKLVQGNTWGDQYQHWCGRAHGVVVAATMTSC